VSRNRIRFLKDFPSALADGNGAVFIGAGVSMSAGYPSWSRLLRDIGEELGVKSTDVTDLAALAQWSVSENGSANRVRSVIRQEIGVVKPEPLALQVIARLPIKHFWTTNYDELIERAFQAINRPYDVISTAADLAIPARPGAARVYKMHGSVTRLDDIVISTDDYELYRKKRRPYLPLLEAHLTSMSMLFVGLSFTDPNVRHVLSLIRESFAEAPPEHFAIVRPPHRNDYDTNEEFDARFAQHRLWANDLRRYGLRAVEIEDYDEVPELLRLVERRVAMGRVWISGSWLSNDYGALATRVYTVAEGIGRAVGESGRALVSGAGVLVGSASLSGFVEALRAGGGWDLERRLIARPFPQSRDGGLPERAKWTALRQEMARLSGIVVFVGGTKLQNGGVADADGVIEEADLAERAGAFLLPIGATGGAAETIAARLLGSAVLSTGTQAQRPTDNELKNLGDKDASEEKLVKAVMSVIDRVSGTLAS
jgi:hypothetical protein